MSGRVAGKKMLTATVASTAVTHNRAIPLVNTVVLGVVALSAFAVIQSTHACRSLYSKLQVLEADQWYLQEDYGRLLLEESTWASHYRIERVARGELGMSEPDLARYVVVTK